MKLALTALVALWLTPSASAQGVVEFLNGPSMLVSVGAPGQTAPISGPAGSYFFGLLTAPLGTADPAQFSFAGVYATNRGNYPGEFTGAMDATVLGWMPGVTGSFLVAGWSVSLGHDWNAEWQKGVFGGIGYFGLSTIGSGAPGGPGLPPTPSLLLFGSPTGIQTGFDLLPVPEPSVLSLGIAGGALLLARLYRRPGSNQGNARTRRGD